MKFLSEKGKYMFLLFGITITSFIGIQTGISGYWKWLLFRSTALYNHHGIKPKWEHLRGNRMLEYVQPLNDTILIQPTNTSLGMDEPFAVIFIIITPEAKERRKWIRNTWYKWRVQNNIRVLFFMGTRRDSRFNYSEIEMESKLYQDIVLDTPEEHYYALPIKILRVLKFYLQAYNPSLSQREPFLIKVDDDVFLNLPKLVKELKSKSSGFMMTPEYGFTAGHVHQFSKPNNDPRSKYYVPPGLWDEYWFPAYAGGPCYAISANLVRRIYDKSLEMPFFPFEDVFITGIVGNHGLGVSPVNIKGIDIFVPDDFISTDKFIDSVALAPLKMSQEFMSKCFTTITALTNSSQATR